MNNLSSYCGLVDAVSDKDLPLTLTTLTVQRFVLSTIKFVKSIPLQGRVKKFPSRVKKDMMKLKN